MNLLVQIQQATWYQHLNPNELRAVLLLLQFICKEGKKHWSSLEVSEVVEVATSGETIVQSADWHIVTYRTSRQLKHEEIPANLYNTEKHDSFADKFSLGRILVGNAPKQVHIS